MKDKLHLVEKYVERFTDDLCVLDEHGIPDDLWAFQGQVFRANSRQLCPDFTRWVYQEGSRGSLVYCRKERQVIGQQGAIHTTLIANGHHVNACWAIDLRIIPEWKMRGIGVALIGNLLVNEPIVLGIGISREARRMFERQGWLSVGRLDSYIRPISLYGMDRIGKRDSFAVSMTKRAAMSAVLLYDSMRRIATKGHRRDFEFRQVSKFERCMDDVFAENLLQHRFCAERSADFLNWRFSIGPFCGRYEKFVIYRRRKVIGAMVYCVGSRNGKGTLFVDELLVPEEHIGTTLDFLIEQARILKLDAVYYQGLSAPVRRRLAGRLFIKRTDGAHFMVFAGEGSRFAGVEQAGNWRLTAADGDIGFSLDS